MKKLLIPAFAFWLSCLFPSCTSTSPNHFLKEADYRNKVEADFGQKKEILNRGNLFDIFNEDMSLEEREAMMFLYAYMTPGDISDYSGEFYLKNVRLALQNRKETSWGAGIPDMIFRHFVLPVRVNNENLDNAREVFRQELMPRVEKLSMYDAVLEVNHWCHEKVIYTPTDIRTSAPMATVKTAYGRCGEESTFLVAALRAVGIPARQVYTPRWAHTDDNHAWVEAWVDGKWYFLGACEPEPVLNLGWFNAPASRGMLMHTKVFGAYDGPEEVMKTTKAHHQMHNAALYYTSGFGFQAGADYTYFTSTDTQDFFDRSPEEVETRFISCSDQYIDRWKIYADQHHTLSQNWTLNYGTSFTYVNNRNTQNYDLPEMQGNNLHSRIREYTYNVYAGFDKPFNSQWTLSASATIEYYQMQEYRKWAVYPTLQLNYMPSASHILQLSFSSDKTYPDYWTLSGATSYLNGYNESLGNPFLRPYTDYNVDLTYILKSKYIFQASYSYTPDYFMQTVYLDSDRLKAIYNWQNWDYAQDLSFTAILPFKAGSWWDSRLTLQATLKHDKASVYYDAPFNQKQWVGVGHWTHTFQLCRQPNLKMEVTAFGQTKSIQGSYDIQPVAFVDAALRYTFAKDKAMLQLKGRDLFNTMNPKTKVRNGAQHLDMNTKSYMQSITLSFSYRFGGYKKKEVKEVDTSRFGN